MIYGKLNRKAFAVCDPRKEVNENSSSTNTTDNLSTNTNQHDHHQAMYDIPPQYSRPKSHRGKQRINRYDYSKNNKSSFVGLENSLPNAYINSTLQFMYFFHQYVNLYKCLGIVYHK